MPKLVVEKKSKEYLICAVINTILCLIPIGIIALVSIKNPGVWSAPYPKFMLYFLAIHTFFAVVVGYVGQFKKIVYIIFQSIAVLGTLTLIVLGYALGNPIIMHLATSSLFVLMLYLFSNFNGNGYYFRYSASVVVNIASLITVLWFVGVGMSTTAHVVIVSILNVIFGSIAIFPMSVEIKDHFSFIEDKEVSISEETKEEILAKKQQKQLAREERKSLKKQNTSAKSIVSAEQKIAYAQYYGAESKWMIDKQQIQYLFEKIENKANSAVGDLNGQIYRNNAIIHNSDFESAKQAENNNKVVNKQFAKLKKSVKQTNKYLTKIANRVFNIDDCGKTFVYTLANGRCKVEKYDGDKQLQVKIVGFQQKFYYDDYGYALFNLEIPYDEFRLKKIY